MTAPGNRCRIAVVVLGVVLGLSGCKKPAERESGKERSQGVSGVPSGHVDEEAHAEIPRHVRLSPEVVANAKIATAPVGSKLAISVSM